MRCLDNELCTSFRVFWVLVVLVMLAMFLNVFIAGIITYFEYPSNTKISIQPRSNLNFPAVTICNNNRVSRLTFLTQPYRQRFTVPKVYFHFCVCTNCMVLTCIFSSLNDSVLCRIDSSQVPKTSGNEANSPLPFSG